MRNERGNDMVAVEEEDGKGGAEEVVKGAIDGDVATVIELHEVHEVQPWWDVVYVSHRLSAISSYVPEGLDNMPEPSTGYTGSEVAAREIISVINQAFGRTMGFFRTICPDEDIKTENIPSATCAIQCPLLRCYDEAKAPRISIP